MAFKLGNHNVDEIIQMVLEDFDGNIIGTISQLKSAEISITSDSVDITDKNGNIVRTIYRTKQGEFTATNAFMNPHIMNASSGSTIEMAAADHVVVMPRVVEVEAGKSIKAEGAIAGTIKVIGLFGSGANGKSLVQDASEANYNGGKFKFDSATSTITVPPAGAEFPTSYLVKYDRNVTEGMKLTNDAKNFPSTCKATLYCSYVDPCDDDLRAMYVELPSLQFSPETTMSFDAESQEMDMNATIQVSYCAAQPVLYNIYYPDENAVKSALVG